MPNTCEPQKSWSNLDSILVLSFAILVLIFCRSTIFEGRPISKIGLISKADLLLNPEKKDAKFSCTFDPSLYQIHAPTNILTEKIWKEGIIPLWNSQNGCGHSLIGDPQSFLFSPFRLIFPTSNLYWYNLGLVFELFLGGLFTYLLARSLKLESISALFAATAYSFSPYYLWYFELPSHNALFPLAFYLLVSLYNNPTRKQSLITGTGCAGLIYTMHPECSFFSISFASLFYLLLALSNKVQEGSSKIHHFYLSVKPLFVSGITALCISAPLLIPFAEFVYNSTSYKTGTASMGSQPVPWYILLANQLYPANAQESPFIGALALTLLIVALFNLTRITKSVASLTLVSFLLTTYPGPILNIMSLGPLSVIVPVYCLPVFLLSVSILAAQGLSTYLNGKSHPRVNKILIASCIAAIVLPLLLTQIPLLSSKLYAAPLSTYFVNNGSLRMESFIPLAGFLAILFFLPNKKNNKIPIGIAVLIVILNLASQVNQAQIALAPQKTFSFETPELVKEIQSKTDRSLATGIHTYLPNSNMVYGAPDFRLYNPFFPDRYLNFIREAGAQKHDLYLYGFNNNLSKLLDLASVKYVISQEPLIESLDEIEKIEPALDSKESKQLGKDLELIEFTGHYSKEIKALFVDTTFIARKAITETITAQAGLINLDNKSLFVSRKQLITPINKNSSVKLKFSLPIPVSLENKTLVTPAITIERSQGASKSFAYFLNSVQVDKSLITRQQQEKHRFKLLKEDKHGIRLYENTHALPPCYFVSKRITVPNGTSALEEIKKSSFNPNEQVVLESNDRKSDSTKPMVPRLENNQSELIHTLNFNRTNTNQVDIEINTNKPGILVLTDTFYPGWEASVDNKVVEIMRANYLFRAVNIPGGSHTVRFRYNPKSFIAGLGISVAFLVLMLIYTTVVKYGFKQENQ